MKIRIGTRGSELALWQAEWVKTQLERLGAESEIKVIHTTGDQSQSPLPDARDGKGLFIREIEAALLAEEIGIAVHSLKDMPTEQPAGLVIAAVPERGEVRDALISREGQEFAQLPEGARIATSSPRRQAQLMWVRPDLEFIPMRGNVPTRVKKLDRGECDAVVLAAAGLERLQLAARVTQILAPSFVLPAVGQGALAIEARADDSAVIELMKPLEHAATRQAVTAERALLRRLGGGCRVPIAAWGRLDDDELRLSGLVASADGTQLLRVERSGSSQDPEALGVLVAEDLLQLGAGKLLAA